MEQASPHRFGPDRRRVTAAVALAVLMMVTAVIAATAISLHRHRRVPAPSPAPSTADINRRSSVRLSRFVTVEGDKILSRSVTDLTTAGPLGLIRLSPAEPGAAANLAVSPTGVVAEGTDLSGVEKAGTWAYPTAGGTPPVFLGPSTGFVLSVDSRSAWLATGTTVREVDVSSGSTGNGPYSVGGHLVAAAGAGLVIQRGEQVVWWVPGAPGTTEVIGSGHALSALGDYILWQTSSGAITVTDPNTRRTAAVAFSLPAAQHVETAAMTSDLFRVAMATGPKLIITDTFKHHRVDVRLGQVNAMAWLDDNTLLVRVGARGVAVIDAASGVVAHEQDLSFDAHGLAVIQSSAS